MTNPRRRSATQKSNIRRLSGILQAAAAASAAKPKEADMHNSKLVNPITRGQSF